jgi:hypothetical protein
MEEEFLPEDLKDKLWKEVVEKGRKQEKGTINRLNEDELTTIVATADAFRCNPKFISQIAWDLSTAKYKLYDWIGMLLSDRYKGYGETPTELKNAERFTRVIAELYAQYSIPEMITILREIDFDIPAYTEKLFKREKIEVHVPSWYAKDWEKRLKKKFEEEII